MNRQSRELKKQQERAKKYGCDGRCYWSTGMCPSVEICDETRVGEAIATAIGLITVLAMIAMIPIIVIGGAIIYYIVMNVVLWLKLPSDDLKLFSAIVVAVFLAIPYLKSTRKGKER